MPCNGTHLNDYDPADVDTCYVKGMIVNSYRAINRLVICFTPRVIVQIVYCITDHEADVSTYHRSHHGAGSFWHSMTSADVVAYLKGRAAKPTQRDLVNAIADQVVYCDDSNIIGGVACFNSAVLRTQSAWSFMNSCAYS